MKIIQPQDVIEIDDEFAEEYHDSVVGGLSIAAEASVAVVGLARNIAQVAPLTMERLEKLSKLFLDFSVVIVENDSDDGTPELLGGWEPEFDVTLISEKLDRPHLPAQRDAERTVPLAEYRQKCLEIVRDYDDWPDYVIVMDYDSWGGYLAEGIMSSLHYLKEDGLYYGMASMGLAQIPQLRNNDGTFSWFNYDAWAFRPLYSWRQRPEMWMHHWKPPFGAPPIEVNSAFGGLCVYSTEDYLRGRYVGTLFGRGDCEHVAFHRSISQATGKMMGLNPSSVGVMFWQDEEEARAADAA